MRYGSYAVLAALCLVLSCAAPASSPGGQANPDLEAFVGNAAVVSPDAPATVMVGGEFAVVLEENPSTGYRWAYSTTPAGLVTEAGKQSFSPAAQPMVGAPVDTAWKFRAEAEGQATLTYLYYRPWEKPETAVKRMTYTVKIVK